MITLVNLKSLYCHIYIVAICVDPITSQKIRVQIAYLPLSSDRVIGSSSTLPPLFLFSFVVKAILYVYFKKQNHSIIFIKGGKGSILTNSTWGT